MLPIRSGRARQIFHQNLLLQQRIAALPEGGTRIRLAVTGARFAESAGKDAAAAWREVGNRYPWSLGVVEDEADFFFRRVDRLMSRFPFYGREKAEQIARDEIALRDLLGDDMGDVAERHRTWS